MSRPRELDYTKIRIFQAHDLAIDPESNKFKDKLFQDSFHKFVFISNWQYNQYQLVHNIPYDEKSIVIESGIETAPENVFDMKDKEKIRIVYTSTPQRGLEILVPVFELLAQQYPNIHLDVFSSFKIFLYGAFVLFFHQFSSMYFLVIFSLSERGIYLNICFKLGISFNQGTSLVN